MQPLLERLRRGGTLLADGAIGTMLLQRGLEPGACTESINLTGPQILEEIARCYLDAGAEIIQTNTLGGSPLKLAMYDLDRQTEEINRCAVRAAQNVVGDRAYVSASCGPCGRILQPYGDANPDEVYDGFRRQMSVLLDAGVDVICVETMIDLAEATLAVKAAKDISPDTPVMATMTFDATPKGFFTVMGVNVEQAASGLRAAGADIVGSNCGNGIENMVRIAAEFVRHTDLPLLIQSNAGLPEMKGGELVYGETPEFMADKARELVALGVSIIGGCCGTTPEHTAALRQMLDSPAAQ